MNQNDKELNDFFSKYNSFEEWWNQVEPFGFDNPMILKAHEYYLEKRLHSMIDHFYKQRAEGKF